MDKAKKVLGVLGEVSGDKYTVLAGRQIYKDGKPFIGIQKSGDTHPSDADSITHVIADLLNKHGDGGAGGPKRYWAQSIGKYVSVPED